MNILNKQIIKLLPILSFLIWTGCEDLDFPDPNNPTSETATIQSLVTGAEAQMRSGYGVWLAKKPTRQSNNQINPFLLGQQTHWQSHRHKTKRLWLLS